MKHTHEQPIVGLFIDGDNAPAKKIDFIVNELAAYGSVMVRKIYGNWKDDRLSGWAEILLDYAIAPIQQFDYTKGKNATDMVMTIDIMDLLFQGKIDVFCIVSSDSDFTPLAMRIKMEGKQVIGFGEQKTPKSLVAACNKFLFLDSLQSENKDGLQDSSAQNGLRKMTGTELKGNTTLMNLLRDAISHCRDDEGWASLNRVGQIIKNQSSFDSKNYGYAKLGDLVRAIDIFETKLDRSQLYLKNKRDKTKC
ncbi:NYN domain [Kingella potus]|uniref:NYN domain n=1 Tax=Kingella potus TaxID=265175 RepID=A0A377R0Y4_9NEIS|nr:NYN domain-containing protein [Kingella potus]UOP00369.1 NYN domain-containing protein [Kingella potus]STR02568.1 NYN domain [Kingella potus]